MKATRAVTAMLIVACSGPAKQSPPVPPMPEPPAPAKPVEEAPPPPTSVDVDVSPTVPSGADAARDTELGKLAAAYVNAFTNDDVVFTRDGKRIVFVSNRDGLPQLYLSEVNKAAAPAKRLTETMQRVSLGATTKDGKAVVFRSDTGADENWSIFRIDLDGKNLVELTTGDKLSRQRPLLVDGAPDKMFFAARAMREAKTTLYSASVTTPGAAKPVYTSEAPAFITDVDGKATHALVIEMPSRRDTSLMRVDLASGKAEKVYPHTDKATLFDAAYSADGKLIYVATDGGGEQNMLVALDAKSGKQVAQYKPSPATAAIQSIKVAKKGGRIAIAIAAGPRSEIVLLDGKKLSPAKQKVKLPLGTGAIAAFAEDGKQLAATWSTPSSPQDILAIDSGSGATKPLRMESRPTLQSMPKIDVQLVDIPAADGAKIPANVYVPAGEHDKPHPVLVVFHGGPSLVSKISWSPGNEFVLSLGYAIVEPNVRGSGGFGRGYEAGDNGKKRLDAFKDMETSARWVAQQPWADKTKLVVGGESYGGYAALVALARWPDIWRAGIDYFGIVNLKTFMATTSGAIRKVFQDEFGDPDKDAEFLAQISPLTDVDKIADPLFVYAGANDPRVPKTESDQIVKALRQRGVAVEYMVVGNEGHSLSRTATYIEALARTARFLETALK